MTKFKKYLRLCGLVLLILLALCGIGFTGVVPRIREQDIDNETKTELVEGTESMSEERN